VANSHQHMNSNTTIHRNTNYNSMDPITQRQASIAPPRVRRPHLSLPSSHSTLQPALNAMRNEERQRNKGVNDAATQANDTLQHNNDVRQSMGSVINSQHHRRCISSSHDIIPTSSHSLISPSHHLTISSSHHPRYTNA